MHTCTQKMCVPQMASCTISVYIYIYVYMYLCHMHTCTEDVYLTACENEKAHKTHVHTSISRMHAHFAHT